MTDTVQINITSNLPGEGVATSEVTQMSIEEYLAEKGVDVGSATVMVNGEPASLSSVLQDGDRLTVAKDGKSA